MPLESATYIDGLVTTNPVGASDQVAQGDDHLRLIKATIKNSFPNITKTTYLQQVLTNVASAATTDLGAVASDYVNITGVVTITSFGTVAAGVHKFIRFDNTLTLTYNATSLILPSDADISTVAGDHAFAISLGSGNWVVLFYLRDSGKALVLPTIGDLGIITGLTEKTDPVLADSILLSDSEASDANKYMTLTNLLKQYALLTAETTIDTTNDRFMFLDADATPTDTPKLIIPDNVTVGAANLAPGSILAILEDQKTSGTNGGTATSGSWATRDLNTEVYDRDAYVSLSANEFTLIAGTYEIVWSAPARFVQGHQTRLYNATDLAVVAYGSSEHADDQAAFVITRSVGAAVVTIASPKAFRIEHRVETTRATDGLGSQVNFTTDHETYTQVLVRKA